MGTRWLLAAALLFGFVHQALTQTCNGDVMQNATAGDNQVCFIESNTSMSWDDARMFCRSQGGALPSTSVVFEKRFNGLNNLWSGYFKQDNQAMQETAATPIRAVFDPAEWNLQVGIDISQTGCALFIRKSNRNGDSYELEWKSCGIKKKFICEVPVPLLKPSQIEDTQSPTLFVTNGVQESSKEEVHEHSWVLRSALVNSSIAQGEPLDIVCKAGLSSPLQNVTFFRDNIPIATIKGGKRDAQSETSYYLDKASQPPMNDLNEIKMIGFYHCEVNDLKTHKILKSNRLFLRPTDLEFYFARFQLSQPQNRMLWRWNTLKLELLFDAWESRDVMELNLNATFYRWLKYRVKIVSLRAKTLVTYIYKSISNGNVSTPENPEKIDQLLELGKKLKGQVVGDFQVESVSIRSIDSCLKEVRSNSSVNESLSLPDTLWNCPLEQETGTLITSTESTKGNNGTCLWGTTTVSNNGNYTTKNPESPITRQLHDLSQSFEERDVPKVAEELRNLTSEVQPEDAVEKDVILIADTLQEITNISKKLPQSTVQNLLDTVSKVSRFPESSLGGTQNGSGATTRILHTIDKLGALLQIEEDQSHKRIVSEGFGLEVWDIDKQSPDEDIVIGIKVLAEGDKKLNESEKLVTQFYNTKDNSDTEAAIYLPKEILKHYTGREGSPKVRLVMNVYRDTSLYENSASDSEEVEGVNITLNSRVIAAQLLVNGQQITNLTDHKVQIVFKPKESKGRSQCAFWDFSANLTQGHWNTSGCKYRDRVDGRDVCECDHLTNFAVLVSFKSQSTLEHTEALGYITLIGLILSIVGLTISILSFLCIKKLRQGRPQQTMFQLSVALLLSWVVFLAGVNRTSDHTGCVVVAALLHYLILASFMWMLMEAVVQFLLFVRVMNPHISHYMWKMGLPSWGVPVIPVVITLSIDPDLYIGGPKYCWMSRQVFYYGFALPVGIIISANLVIFCLICVSLFRRKDMSKHSSMKANQTMVNLRACSISFCMLGLTWIFGFLAIEHARLVFQFLFCITSSLQGFFIFLMITARDRQVRRFWLNNVCCCMKRCVKSESSSGVTPSTTTAAAARARKPKLMDRILSRELKRGQTPPTSTTSTGITMASDNQYESFL